MPNVAWDESTPADGDSLGQGDDIIRSLKSAIRTGLDSEHVWPSSGGAGVGVHRAGSARAFVGVQSLVSSADTAGRLMVTSDTSRLFGVGSNGTCLLGAGPNSLSLGTTPANLSNQIQRHCWVEEVGAATSFPTAVTIPNSGYSGLPYVFLSVWNESDAGVMAKVNTVSKTGFTLNAYDAADVPIGSGITVFWRSLGSRVL